MFSFSTLNVVNAVPDLLLTLYDAALRRVDPFVHACDGTARWLKQRSSRAPIRIVALGKAAPQLAAGAVAAMRAHAIEPAGGVVVASHAPPAALALPPTLIVRVGDHPLPELGSLAAADAIANALAAIDFGDDVLVLLSGGASSLCAAPCAELSALVGHPAEAQQLLAELMETLMHAGVGIHELNAIRRRLLRWGAGRLATALHARGVGQIRVLAISDVARDDPAVIASGPCTADPLDDNALLAICDAQQIRSVIAPLLGRALGLSGHASVAVRPPAASHPAFARVSYSVILNNADACEAMASAAHAEGIDDVQLERTPIEGEAEWLGVAIAHAAISRARQSETGAVLIWGGEPTVRLNRDTDDGEDDETEELQQLRAAERGLHDAPLGGRMQTLALAAALALSNAAYVDAELCARIKILAAGTDGRDGPTDAAGAVIDVGTANRIRRAGRDPEAHLRYGRSYHALNAADALLRVGPTGTNVMDVVVALISPATEHATRHTQTE